MNLKKIMLYALCLFLYGNMHAGWQAQLVNATNYLSTAQNNFNAVLAGKQLPTVTGQNNQQLIPPVNNNPTFTTTSTQSTTNQTPTPPTGQKKAATKDKHSTWLQKAIADKTINDAVAAKKSVPTKLTADQFFSKQKDARAQLQQLNPIASNINLAKAQIESKKKAIADKFNDQDTTTTQNKLLPHKPTLPFQKPTPPVNNSPVITPPVTPPLPKDQNRQKSELPTPLNNTSGQSNSPTSLPQDPITLNKKNPNIPEQNQTLNQAAIIKAQLNARTKAISDKFNRQTSLTNITKVKPRPL